MENKLWQKEQCIGRLTDWIKLPYPAVSPQNGGLLTLPNCDDSVSQTKSKTYQSTSWNSFARSYVCGLSVSSVNTSTPVKKTNQKNYNIVLPDKETLAKQSAANRKKYRLGLLVYTKELGFTNKSKAEIKDGQLIVTEKDGTPNKSEAPGNKQPETGSSGAQQPASFVEPEEQQQSEGGANRHERSTVPLLNVDVDDNDSIYSYHSSDSVNKGGEENKKDGAFESNTEPTNNAEGVPDDSDSITMPSVEKVVRMNETYTVEEKKDCVNSYGPLILKKLYEISNKTAVVPNLEFQNMTCCKNITSKIHEIQSTIKSESVVLLETLDKQRVELSDQHKELKKNLQTLYLEEIEIKKQITKLQEQENEELDKIKELSDKLKLVTVQMAEISNQIGDVSDKELKQLDRMEQEIIATDKRVSDSREILEQILVTGNLTKEEVILVKTMLDRRYENLLAIPAAIKTAKQHTFEQLLYSIIDNIDITEDVCSDWLRSTAEYGKISYGNGFSSERGKANFSSWMKTIKEKADTSDTARKTLKEQITKLIELRTESGEVNSEFWVPADHRCPTKQEICDAFSSDPSDSKPPNQQNPGSRRKRGAGNGKQVHRQYAAYIPVRSINVSNALKTQTEREHSGIPFSTTYALYNELLSDTTSRGTLGANIRGPNVRDIQGVASLCKSISAYTGSLVETAAGVRCMCMSMSLQPQNYMTDISVLQMIRKTKAETENRVFVTNIKQVNKEAGKIGAITLDNFVAMQHGRFVNEINPVFTPNQIDQTWTAVPVREELIGTTMLLPYIISFLSSKMWNGTVTNVQNYSATILTLDNAEEEKQLRSVTMPCINSVFIDGPLNVLLVLTSRSEDSSEARLMVGDLAVPIYKRNRAYIPVEYLGTWNAYWRTDNINKIRRDMLHVWKELVSIFNIYDFEAQVQKTVSELYMGARIGCYFAPSKDKNGMTEVGKYEPYAQGAIMLTDVLDKDAAYGKLCEKATVLGREIQGEYKYIESIGTNITKEKKLELDTEWEETLNAFNFSSLSALHLLPISYTTIDADDEIENCSWQKSTPDQSRCQYRISTMSSLTRVAAHIGFFERSSYYMDFKEPNAIGGWYHNNSVVMGNLMGLTLAENNTSVRKWTGLDVGVEEMCGREPVIREKRVRFGSFLIHFIMNEATKNWEFNWENEMLLFYGLRCYENDEFMRDSPVNMLIAHQWIEKISANPGLIGKWEPLNDRHGQLYRGNRVVRETGLGKLYSYATINTCYYMPQVVEYERDEFARGMWCEQIAWLSNQGCNADGTIVEFFQTMLPTFTMIRMESGFLQDMTIHIVNSNYKHPDEDYRTLKATKIQFPDPPDVGNKNEETTIPDIETAKEDPISRENREEKIVAEEVAKETIPSTEPTIST